MCQHQTATCAILRSTTHPRLLLIGSVLDEPLYRRRQKKKKKKKKENRRKEERGMSTNIACAGSNIPSSKANPAAALMVAVSGCSSSGKTTLSRMLRDLFPGTLILHEDDFYRPEAELPVRHGHRDWDCVEAINVADMAAALCYVCSHAELPVSIMKTASSSKAGWRTDHGILQKEHKYLQEMEREGEEYASSQRAAAVSEALEQGCGGARAGAGAVAIQQNSTDMSSSHLSSVSSSSFSSSSSTISSSAKSLTTPSLNTSIQPAHESKEEQNIIGVNPVCRSEFDLLSQKVKAWLAALPRGRTVPKICIMDGFLLFTPALESVSRFFDLRLFLLVSREKAVQRRSVRDGYVTLEGFWKDPPGYMNTIVWPNYAAAHAWMFVNKDAESGVLDAERLAEKGVVAQTDKGPDVDMHVTLNWAVHQIMHAVEQFIGLSK